MSLLEVENITVKYGEVTALRDVSLRVEEDEFVALLGPNGAGKSTCLKAIAGGVPVTAGSIRYKGDDITGQSTRQRVKAGISLCPEERQLFPKMTVEENLDVGGHLLSDSDRKAELLEEVFQIFPRIEERRNQVAQTLSGGEQQMVAIARSLMSDPEIMLLDEPSLGLAPNLITQTGEFINRLNEEMGITILIVEQNIEIPFDHSDRLYLLKTGSIQSEDRTENLRDSDDVRESYLGI